MGKRFTLAVLTLVAAFLLYDPKNVNENAKRSPVISKRTDQDSFPTVYKTLEKSAETAWKTFTATSQVFQVTHLTETTTITSIQSPTATVTRYASTNAPSSEADFQALYNVIHDYIIAFQASDGIDLRPKYVRAVFHDLMYYDGSNYGSMGCIFDSPISDFAENHVCVSNASLL